MIPVRLSLRNFMCYRDSTEVLDLTGVHLACLSGENGAGKSALLEAITWSLWGKARDRVMDDELISMGATEMEVDFEFILNGDAYRVIRKRAMKGKQGQTVLEMQIGGEAGSGQWRTISGATVRESQARITGLLKLDYDTFINSAFIMQGRADKFTMKSPTERKQVLADILGLEQYERLEEEAKEEARIRAGSINELKGIIDREDKELILRPGYTNKLEGVEEQLVTQQARLSAVRAELADIVAREQALEHSKQRLEEMRKRIDKREYSMDVLKVRITRNDTRKRELEGLLSQREEIEKGYAEWQELQGRDRQLNETRSALDTLEKEKLQLDGVMAVERGRVDSECGQRQSNIRRLTQSLQGREVVEGQLSEVLGKLARLTKLQQQHEDTRCERDRLNVRLQTVTRERNALEEEGKVIGRKLAMLVEAHAQQKDHVGCPLCGTGLTEDALRRVRESYQHDIDHKRREYTQKQRELDEANKAIVTTEVQLGKERDELKPFEMQRQREAALRNELHIIDGHEKELVKEESLLVAVKMRLDDGDYAHGERERLGTVQAQMKGLLYDGETHAGVRRRLEELRPYGYDSKYHGLEGAGRELADKLENLEEDNRNLAAMRAEQESDRAEVELLAPQVMQLAEVKGQRVSKEREAATLDKEITTLRETRGTLKNNLARCDKLQEEKRAHVQEYQTAVEEKGIYDELTVAFGKKGIQAMIIENIIPEVEEEANTLLHRMTDGRMSVQFQTQRDAKSSKNVIETLDIEIADEVGMRPYEMYSGGEAFRVNFAVRIALSKLLARRAGTQLQTLVIDEGFGSQDGQGREKLVGAIRSIQDDFEKILVITHIEELKDEFPTRINIVKTGTGSKIVMGDGE